MYDLNLSLVNSVHEIGKHLTGNKSIVHLFNEKRDSLVAVFLVLVIHSFNIQILVDLFDKLDILSILLSIVGLRMRV